MKPAFLVDLEETEEENVTLQIDQVVSSYVKDAISAIEDILTDGN